MLIGKTVHAMQRPKWLLLVFALQFEGTDSCDNPVTALAIG